MLKKGLKTKMELKEISVILIIILLSVILLFIDFSYPLTLTYDSAHYLWLSSIIKNRNWMDWDPVRNIGFPFFLFIGMELFGSGQLAFAIPMYVLHVLLFIFSSLIIINNERLNNKEKITVVILVFVFIATDPTVIGYFHTLLTEFMAAIIGAISIYIAIIFYKSTPFTKEFYFALAYFFLGVPLAWHIKQPYFGITFFPFFISLIFFLIRNKIKYKLILFTITLLIPVIFTFISTNLWNSFLISKGNPMKQERQLSYYVDMSLNENFVDLEFSPRKIIVNVVKRYAALSNYLQYDHMNFVFIDERPSFFQAKENTAISHRMFQNQSLSNSIIFPQERYFEYYSNLLDNYEPPVWLNKIFEKRIILSNFLFTTTYLFLPFLIIPFIYLVFKNMETFPLLLLCGTSLMNAVAHIFVLPIDRYLFWGYPLNLVMVLLITIKIIKRNNRC